MPGIPEVYARQQSEGRAIYIYVRADTLYMNVHFEREADLFFITRHLPVRRMH